MMGWRWHMNASLLRGSIVGRGARLHMMWLISLIAVTLSLISCNASPATPAPPDSPEDLVGALAQAGVEVRLGDEGGEAVLGAIPKGIDVNGERLWVYKPPQPIDESQVIDAFAADGYIWFNGHLIVHYAGVDGGTILLVDGLLGDPIIHPSVAGDEPYPPAVPAALRQVAEALGLMPAEVEVLAYEMVEWEDACLGLGQADEACAEQGIPGWRIELRVEGMEVEVHTDLLGDVVRWQSP